jgi:fibro-slime domain-containing protein
MRQSHAPRTGPNHLHRLTRGVIALSVAAGASLTLPAAASDDDGADGPSSEIRLTGLIRDFRERTVMNGHPDFEKRPDHGFALYCGNISPRLGEDDKPRFTGMGYKVTSQWTDREGRPICYTLYEPARGDVAGVRGASDKAAIESQESFNQWFNDVPGVNLSTPLEIVLTRQDDGSYVFDDKLDPQYVHLGGFFPIEDQLFGNPGGSPDRNFHFTFELHTTFVFDAHREQIFRFVGDDDVWVFVNNRMVIDLGGVHSAREQFVDLARLGLSHGGIYSLHFFFAERHRTQSNFRIHTNLNLESIAVPAVTAAFD